MHNLGQVLLGTSGALTAAAVARCPAATCSSRTSRGWARRCWPEPWRRRSEPSCRGSRATPTFPAFRRRRVSVFSPDTSSWEFRPGPVFAHVVLVDELNRTPPRTQSALLETMEEQQVSVDGQSWPLPRPHMVIATQNPHSQRGTFPLVESQLDRFAIATAIGYPDAANEAHLALHVGGKFALADLLPVCTPEAWLEAQRATESVAVAPAVAQYAVGAVPGHPDRTRGAPRGQPAGGHLAHPVCAGPRRAVRPPLRGAG